MNLTSVRNLYRFELRQNWRSLLLWALFLVLGTWLFMSFFPSMSKADFLDLVNAKVNAIPKGVAQAFGLDGQMNFQNVIYYFSYCWQFFSVALVVYAINLGSNLIAKEHEEKHVDYLATKPIGKGEIVTAKALAGLTLVALITSMVFVSSWLMVLGYDKTNSVHVVELVRLFFKSFAMYVFFGMVAMWVSLMLKKTGRSNMIVLGVFFVSYIVGVMAKIVPSAESLKYLSPFYVFESVKAPYGFTATEWWYIGVLVVLSLILYAIGALNYKEKDLSW